MNMGHYEVKHYQSWIIQNIDLFYQVSHYKDNHPTENIYKCDQCVYGSNYLQNLKMHIDTHHNMTELICNLCDYVTKWNQLFHAHMREKHNVIKKNVRKSATAASTETGEKSSNKHLCDQCDFVTKSKQYLKMHVNSKHNGLSLKCDLCDHTSTSNSNLKKHKDMKHLGKTYNCNVCDYKSKSKQYLTVHLKTHNALAWQMIIIIDSWLWYLLFISLICKYDKTIFIPSFPPLEYWYVKL